MVANLSYLSYYSYLTYTQGLIILMKEITAQQLRDGLKGTYRHATDIGPVIINNTRQGRKYVLCTIEHYNSIQDKSSNQAHTEAQNER